MIRLIACDIDNTIVVKHQSPSERTIKCINEFNKRGILFGLASGRQTYNLKTLADNWGIHCDFFIGLNGGEIQDEISGKHEALPNLSKEGIKEIFEVMKPFLDQVNTAGTFAGNTNYLLREDPVTREIAKYNKYQYEIRVVESIDEFCEHEFPKVGFRTPAEIMPQVEAYVNAHPSKYFSTVKTEYTMFEFIHKDADKGKMLEKFCNWHNIPIEDTVAFGDMSNDVTLLKKAGLGVCLLNGSDDAKEASDVITEKTITDDGFADYVEKHILI